MDPRWQWVEITTWGDPAPVYVKGKCNHTDVVPVEAGGIFGDGEVLAHLCLTCDAQLPAEVRP